MMANIPKDELEAPIPEEEPFIPDDLGYDDVAEQNVGENPVPETDAPDLDD